MTGSSVGRGIRSAAAAAHSASRGKRATASVVAVAAAVAMIGVASSQGATHHAAAKGTVTMPTFGSMVQKGRQNWIRRMSYKG